jgi:hypothetical protein
MIQQQKKNLFNDTTTKKELDVCDEKMLPYLSRIVRSCPSGHYECVRTEL